MPLPVLITMVRINIDDVKIGTLTLHDGIHLVDGKTQAKRIAGDNCAPEAFSHAGKQFIGDYVETVNPLIRAVHLAFANHVPLELSPDVIFNVILQGVSHHVGLNPEAFRGVFVSHKGKRQLAVRDDSLVKGDWNNSWDRAILALKDQIFQTLAGDANSSTRKVLSTRFSTTGPAEAMAHACVFMDVVKNYYTYTVMTECGIPYVNLTGTKADWVALGKVVHDFLLELKLDGWDAVLQGILQEFVLAFDGKANREFWKGIYDHEGSDGSGGVSKVSGWIAKFFLYTQQGMNPFLKGRVPAVPRRTQPKAEFEECPWKDPGLWAAQDIEECPWKEDIEIEIADFPVGQTNTPIQWEYLGTPHLMQLTSGLVGVTLTDQGRLRAELGWAISDTGELAEASGLSQG